MTPAAVADHIEPHKGNLDLFFDDGNLMSLCKTCHDVTKQREEHRGFRQGCDSSGVPFSRRVVIN